MSHLNQQPTLKLLIKPLKLLVPKYVVNLVFFLFGQPSFLIMVMPIEQVPISLSLEEVAVCAGHKVSMEVDNNNALIVGDLLGILGQQAQASHNLITKCYYDINFLINYIIKLTTILSNQPDLDTHPSHSQAVNKCTNQGMLTEGEGSVRLTSSLRQVSV